jgi:hypothetical protein
VVLTLADSEVLERDEHGMVKGIANSELQLENALLTEDAKAQERKKRETRAKRGAYRGTSRKRRGQERGREG